MPDDGFIMGGQSNNQLYLIRTNSSGDTLWTKAWGTSGIENIECVNFAQGGNGFILAGTTNGAGAGGEDGYLVMTDTGGVQVWAKTVGGADNDGYHRVEQTSDGGYVCVGTSSMGPWANPNLWIVKFDGSGTKQWDNYFGGDNHDHGYSGQPTSDGGYILVGHTHSFVGNNNLEDGMIIKTNSSGQVSTPLTWTTVSQLMTPLTGGCGVSNAEIKVELKNYGITTVSSIPVTIEITGAITQTLSQTLSSTVAPGATKTLTFTTNIDMSSGGTYNFHCYTGNPHDIIPAHNYIDKTLNVGVTSQPPTVTNGTHCGPSTVDISASSPDQIKWYAAATGGSSLSTGSNYTTPYLTSTTTYYAQAGTTCPSTRVATSATITAGITPPTVTDGSRCGPGTVGLSASSASPIKWYDTGTSMTSLNTGSSYTTSSLSSSSTYYVASDNGTCSSTRVAVHAVINAIAAQPTATPGTTCGSGTVALSASASDPIKWYAAASGGSPLATGSNFTTPVLTNTTTYYVLADDGVCPSSRIPVVATVASIPTAPVTTSDDRCGPGTVDLSATSASTIKWFDASVGGTQVGTGNSFTTPSISATTTYYALSDNGPCRSARVPATATINAIPADPVTVPGSRCGDGTVDLSASASDPIEWYDAASGGTLVGNGNTFTTPAISSTTVYYAQTNNGQCSGNAISVAAVVNSLPSINLGPDTIFSATSSYTLDAGAGFAGYLWTSSELTQSILANVSGEYCVTVTDNNTCTASDCVYLELPTGVNELNNANDVFVLYPNPSHGLVTVEMKSGSNFNLSILDLTGKSVFFRNNISDKQSIDLSSLSRGVYLLRLTDGQNTVARRIVIE